MNTIKSLFVQSLFKALMSSDNTMEQKATVVENYNDMVANFKKTIAA